MRLNLQTTVEICIISDNDYLKVLINDDGPGFPDDIKEYLGEPYIKSKDPIK